MRRILITFGLSLLIVSSAFAGNLVPYYDYFDQNDDVFSSPARLTEVIGVTHFAFDVTTFSGVDTLAFFSNPSDLSRYSSSLYEGLMNADFDFWASFYGDFNTILSAFDSSSNIPAMPVNELTLAQMQAYLKDSFDNRFTDSQKAYIVLNALNVPALQALMEDEVMYNDLELSLRFYGGAVYDNGFGWQIESNMGFIGSENLLSNQKNLLAVDVRADVGYAIHLFSDRFSIGGSLELLAAMDNRILNQSLLLARFNDDIIPMFDQNFKFGLGFGVNFGSMYRHNDELAFTLDLVNLVSLRKFYDLEPTDFVDYNGFDEDRATYYQPMDLVLRALWDKGPYHIVVEFSNVVDQLIWMKEYDYLEYDFFAIPKFGFSYDVNKDLRINTKLGSSKIAFGLDYKTFSIELSSALDEFGFGIKAGMKF